MLLISKHWIGAAWTAAGLVSFGLAQAAETPLTVTIEGLDPSGRFPDRAVFCPPPGGGSGNVSPAVTWSKGPAGTKSYALAMSDADVPRDLSLINKAGVTILADAPRIRIFHWVLADIPARLTALAPGDESRGVVPGGKPIGPTSHGTRGANVFTTFLAGTKGMAGTYGGYDGPCPPANDERTHRYSIDVYALDVGTLGLHGAFTGEALEAAMNGHILAKGEAMGTYDFKARP